VTIVISLPSKWAYSSLSLAQSLLNIILFVIILGYTITGIIFLLIILKDLLPSVQIALLVKELLKLSISFFK
jgi:hypothetical protein